MITQKGASKLTVVTICCPTGNAMCPQTIHLHFPTGMRTRKVLRPGYEGVRWDTPNQLVPRGPSTRGKTHPNPLNLPQAQQKLTQIYAFRKERATAQSQTGLSETCGFFTWLGPGSGVWRGCEGPPVWRHHGQEALQPSVHTCSPPGCTS